MGVDLGNSLAWKTAAGDDAIMLDNLQPNIIKAHTRDFLSVLFLGFADAGAGRAFLQSLAPMIKSARVHLQEIEQFKANGIPGTPYIGLGLTRRGYVTLGIDRIPPDPSFKDGMQATAGLNDPPVAQWDPYFSQDIHAVVLVGDMLNEAKVTAHSAIVALINASPGVSLLGTQDGLGQHNANGAGIEHFGYVDGRSQPLFLVEDIEDEDNTTDGTANWDPAFPLGQVIVPNPAAPDPEVHFGSYFIYRKLEQNVKLFKQQEKALADALNYIGKARTPPQQLADDEIAGAMIVGRFEDGTPVTMQFADGVESPVPNNFNYDSDSLGAKCPLPGHIRKTNPRGSGGFGTVDGERSHIMARRGQTYGVRADNPNDGKIENKPEKHVGLLFMAFNNDIGNQFEFTQITWANNPDFPNPHGGPPPSVDPVIGQTPGDAPRPPIHCPVEWGNPGSIATVPNVTRAVTMKGGEYFFMPSLAFLQSLASGGGAK